MAAPRAPRGARRDGRRGARVERARATGGTRARDGAMGRARGGRGEEARARGDVAARARAVRRDRRDAVAASGSSKTTREDRDEGGGTHDHIPQLSVKPGVGLVAAAGGAGTVKLSKALMEKMVSTSDLIKHIHPQMITIYSDFNNANLALCQSGGSVDIPEVL